VEYKARVDQIIKSNIMEGLEIALIIAIILIIVWLFYKEQRAKEGLDARTFARPVAAGYSSTAITPGRSWSSS